MIEIICRNTNSKILVPFGSTLSEVIKFAGIDSEHQMLGAYVNNKVRNLNYKVYMPKTVEFFDIINPNGRRMYAMSLMFVFYKATKELYPKSEPIIFHSMSNGYYAEIKNLGTELNKDIVVQIKEKMQEIIKNDYPFITKNMPGIEAMEIFKKVGLENKANLMKATHKLYVDVDYLDGTVNHFYYPLVRSTSLLNVFDLVHFNGGLLLVMPDKKDPNQLLKSRNKQEKIFSVFQEHKDWVNILGTPYISDLNKVVDNKEHIKLIQVSEALHEKKYSQIADEIYKRKDSVKIVLLSGPSSSGKTTSCRRIATQLSVLGFHPIQLSLDDYFLDREFTPKDENGNYDFESIDALDIELFNNQIMQMLNGEEVSIPRFDFITGKKIFDGRKIKANQNAIFIVEGIHGLNPKLTANIDKSQKYNVFISALTQISVDEHNLISTSDNRLIRRIVRDFSYRGYSATDTLNRWQSVKEGEEKHIFPYQENADNIFNSSLLYELGVLKNYAKPLLGEVPESEVCYSEAKRLLRFLANFRTIDDKSIPPTSVMREFLGGSSFEY
ncbi:MAG: nucleoside kinase [Bacteroidales bacterium]|nr:nucleoside kinase [Bacteroidales bacterium]